MIDGICSMVAPSPQPCLMGLFQVEKAPNGQGGYGGLPPEAA